MRPPPRKPHAVRLNCGPVLSRGRIHAGRWEGAYSQLPDPEREGPAVPPTADPHSPHGPIPPHDAAAPALTLGNIRLRYGGVDGLLALDGVTLRLARGEFVALVGPSGCGKTSLLHVAGGLLSPSDGAVRILGGAPETALRAKRVGFVFQEPALLPCARRERQRRPAPHREPGGRRRRLRGGAAASRRPGGLPRCPPAPAQRRHAAARGPGPRPRLRPRPAADGRTVPRPWTRSPEN